MARPRKPTNLLELTGAYHKNPQRRREREGEPIAPGPLGGPPEKWITFHPLQEEACALLDKHEGLNVIAEALGIPWETASALKDAAARYREAIKLRAIWNNCMAMWPWVTFSDRDALESYCKLKLKEDEDRLTGAELTAIHRVRTDLGGTGSGRARLGVRAAGGSAPSPKKQATDPRAAFLAQKYG